MVTEVIGAAEGLKEDLESWKNFFVWLKSRGLKGVKLIIGDKALGMVEAIGQVFPQAKYQRCIVHFYRNVFSVVPKHKVNETAKMLKAIHAQEDKTAAREKAKQVAGKLRGMKLSKAALKVEEFIEETLTYMNFPEQHWTRIRTNNTLERLNREIKRRTKVVGTFPDGESALMLVCARLRHVTSSEWGTKRYLNMEHLTASCTALLTKPGRTGVWQPRRLSLKMNLRKTIDSIGLSMRSSLSCSSFPGYSVSYSYPTP